MTINAFIFARGGSKGIKNKALDQDMKKHNDVMSRKDQELSIKKSQSNKKHSK